MPASQRIFNDTIFLFFFSYKFAGERARNEIRTQINLTTARIFRGLQLNAEWDYRACKYMSTNCMHFLLMNARGKN